MARVTSSLNNHVLFRLNMTHDALSTFLTFAMKDEFSFQSAPIYIYIYVCECVCVCVCFAYMLYGKIHACPLWITTRFFCVCWVHSGTNLSNKQNQEKLLTDSS